MCIAQAADIFGAGLVAGAFVMGSFAVHPATARLNASPHVLLRQELLRRLSKFMPPIMLFPVVASISAMTLCRTSVLCSSTHWDWHCLWQQSGSVNLMKAGKLPLAQIAVESGFYDQAHFTRAFQEGYRYDQNTSLLRSPGEGSRWNISLA